MFDRIPPSEAAVVGFRKVKAWQKAHALTLGLYRATRSFPREELGLLNRRQHCGRCGRRSKRFDEAVVEVKRMLWGFIRKLVSDV